MKKTLTFILILSFLFFFGCASNRTKVSKVDDDFIRDIGKQRDISVGFIFRYGHYGSHWDKAFYGSWGSSFGAIGDALDLAGMIAGGLASIPTSEEQKYANDLGTKFCSIKTAFTGALRRAGIEDFRFKDLRHTFASHMVMRGATMKEIQELMGHTTMNMTMRYAHLSQEHKKKAVNRLSGLTAPAKKSDGNILVTSTKSQESHHQLSH